MDRYQFESLISEYIEGELSQSKRKDFEDYLRDHEDGRIQVESVREMLSTLHKLPPRQASADFTAKLLKRIEAEKSQKTIGRITGVKRPKTILGFTPAYAGLMGVLVVALIVVALQLVPNQRNMSVPSSPMITNTIKPAESAPITQQKSDFARSEEATDDSTDVPKTLPEHDHPDGMILVKDQ